MSEPQSEVKMNSTESEKKEVSDAIKDVLANKTDEKDRFISEKRQKQFAECRAKLKEKQELNRQVKEALKKEQKEIEELKKLEMQQRIMAQARESLEQKLVENERQKAEPQNIKPQVMYLHPSPPVPPPPMAEPKEKKVVKYIDSSSESDEEIIRKKKKIKKQKIREMFDKIDELQHRNSYLSSQLQRVQDQMEFTNSYGFRSKRDPYSFFTNHR